jgi:hypothetical protein
MALKSFMNKTVRRWKKRMRQKMSKECNQMGAYSTSTNMRGLPAPPESAEQIALFQWAALQEGAYPELSLLYHVPNGGKRYAATARRLKAEGVKPGVPDLCLPVARGGFHGLYIELKRVRGNKATDKQTSWLEALTRQGYRAAVCFGWEAAAEAIKQYLRLRE